jgi:hypothetical protein
MQCDAGENGGKLRITPCTCPRSILVAPSLLGRHLIGHTHFFTTTQSGKCPPLKFTVHREPWFQYLLQTWPQSCERLPDKNRSRCYRLFSASDAGYTYLPACALGEAQQPTSYTICFAMVQPTALLHSTTAQPAFTNHRSHQI